MFEAFGLAFDHMFGSSAVLYLMAGAIVGSFIGFIPGLGGLFALATLLPFAYAMDMYVGIAFLLAAHAVINTTGSITAILFATPGAAGTAATIFDGYPLTCMGQAGRALGANILASVAGGVFGAIVLALAIPVIRPVVLSFASPEFFMLAILGIAMISAVNDGSTVKALIVAMLGFSLSMVGVESSHGIPRFTFDILYLWDGIQLLPVVLGLFAVAEMLELTIRKKSVISEVQPTIGDFLRGMRDVVRHYGLVLRCSTIGSALGAIPGMGGDSINFIAYGHAKQSSKTPEQFGKGAIEGVIGPESANNAKEGGILLPTLAFGIPGAASMAILLGAFQVWGVVPGPSMLKENLHLVHYMVLALVFGNIVGALVCLPLSFYASRLVNIKISWLAPIIVVFSFAGALAAGGHIGDVIVTLVFAVVGLGMKRFGFSRPVFIIALVLGSVAEQHLNLSMRLYSYEFMLRPMTLGILMLALLFMFWPLIRKLWGAGSTTKRAQDHG